MEFIESAKGNGGNTLFENMARWCDEQISKAVLGQTMTADNGSSQSQANVHNEVRMDIAKWDARQLEACVNEYLVKPYIILNWGVQKSYPRVSIKVPEPEDLKMLVDSLKPMIESGMRVSAAEVREKFSLREPKDDEELLMPSALVAMQAMPATGLNRNRLAFNRVSKSAEQEMDEMTNQAMDEWEEIGGEFMNPIIKLANESQDYDAFLAQLPKLQEELGAEGFVEQMAQYMFQMRGYGDVKDA